MFVLLMMMMEVRQTHQPVKYVDDDNDEKDDDDDEGADDGVDGDDGDDEEDGDDGDDGEAGQTGSSGSYTAHHRVEPADAKRKAKHDHQREIQPLSFSKFFIKEKCTSCPFFKTRASNEINLRAGTIAFQNIFHTPYNLYRRIQSILQH